MRIFKILLGGVAAAALAGSANAALLYSNNFDAAASFGAGVSGTFTGLSGEEAAAAGTWNADGWVGEYGAYRASDNSFATLTLNGLDAHTSVSAGFILGFLESWDSRDGGCCAPDELEIWIDGSLAASMTYNNGLGSIKDTDGGSVIAEYVQANGNGGFSDTLVDMSTASFLTFAHTGSSLTLQFRGTGAGWQGGGDEGFGLDDIAISYNASPVVGPGPVPEPATWAMMIAGFGLAGATLRRRRVLIA